MTEFGVLREIQNTTSQKQKLEILKKYSDSDNLQYILWFTYNPQIVTGLSKKKINKSLDLPIKTDTDFFEGLLYLEHHNTGKNEDIIHIQQILQNLNEQDKEMAEEIYTKTLNIGLTAKSINKVFGKDFIPIWEVQQGYPLEDYPFKDGEWFCISQKMNGCRATLYNGEFISRQGKVIAGFDYIKEEMLQRLSSNFNLNDFVFDGELQLINNGTRTDNENYQLGTGIVNSDEADKSNFEFVIFDMIPKVEFDNYSKDNTKFSVRLECGLKPLRYICTNSISTPSPKSFRVVDHYYGGTDQSQIAKWLDYTDTKEYEGCMVNLDVPYKRKRHRGILKVKSFLESDLEIIGVEEGKSKSTQGTLGAFVVDFKGNKVNVGSGFTKAQCDQFWRDRDNLIGRIITVRYKNVTTNKKDNGLSLQFPSFVELREIGKEVSY